MTKYGNIPLIPRWEKNASAQSAQPTEERKKKKRKRSHRGRPGQGRGGVSERGCIAAGLRVGFQGIGSETRRDRNNETNKEKKGDEETYGQEEPRWAGPRRAGRGWIRKSVNLPCRWRRPLGSLGPLGSRGVCAGPAVRHPGRRHGVGLEQHNTRGQRSERCPAANPRGKKN